MGTEEVQRAGLRRRGTIGAYLVGLVSIQLVLVVALIGFAAVQDFRTALSEAERSAQASAVLAADFIGEEIDDFRADMEQIPAYGELLASRAVCEVTDEEQSQALGETLRSRFLLLRRDGSALCPSGRGAYPSAGSSGWLRQALRSDDVVEAGPLTHPANGDQVMVFAIAMPGQDVVVATIVELSTVTHAVHDKFAAASVAPTYVVTDRVRRTLLSADDAPERAVVAGTVFARDLEGDSMHRDFNGDERIYGRAQVRDLGWHVYAGVADADAFAAAWRSLGERGLFALVMILVVMVAAAFLHRRFVQPIRSLARATRKVSEGNLSAKVLEGGPAELRELSESFNDMLDIREQAEAALRKAFRAEQKAAAELRDVDEMRNAFLMAISHELRTPLTSVVGYSTFLDEEMDTLSTEQVRKSIRAITTQSKRLERLMLDLLDVERLSRGIVEPNLVATDVAQLVMRVIDHSSAPTRVRAHIEGDVRADLDPALVERILENLVFNAIKHTPADSDIWVRAHRANDRICLTVEDNGNGVPDELKTAIFEPFVQGEVPEHSPGTGVGLNLVSQFSKLHGGRAWVEDRRGGGAAFRVELPAQPVPAEGRAA